MILALVAKGRRIMAGMLLLLIYTESLVPAVAQGAVMHHPVVSSPIDKPVPPKPVHPPAEADAPAMADFGGPTQPEMQAFHAVGNDKMVDLFSGDFTYNIPLLDVGGYPITIGYNSGISMDQEASWVGLGWNINPGAITRNLRGIPDDFNGKDSILKELSIKENKTIGFTGGASIELAGAEQAGFKISGSLGSSLGIFHNSYRGWGLEYGINAGINAGSAATGKLSAGLSLPNNSQEGLTISPSLGYTFPSKEAEENGGYSGSLSVGAAYNSRSGLKGLQLSGGIRHYKDNEDNSRQEIGIGSMFSSGISYAYPSYTPTINMPFTNKMTTVTLKAGTTAYILHPSFFISGYVTKQSLEEADKRRYMSAYGYLNYQEGVKNLSALMDFNREKELPYREKPPVPHIAIPAYTYDIFSMTGEGTGGTFRAYRNDLGYVYDHSMRTKDASNRLSVDLGFGNIFHGGVDLNFTRSFTQSGLWQSGNPLTTTMAFRPSDKNFEAAYFRNPGEKTVNVKSFFDAIGGDDVVAPRLFQAGNNTPSIVSTNNLTRYREEGRWEMWPLHLPVL